jgi:hypothetical protein
VAAMQAPSLPNPKIEILLRNDINFNSLNLLNQKLLPPYPRVRAIFRKKFMAVSFIKHTDFERRASTCKWDTDDFFAGHQLSGLDFYNICASGSLTSEFSRFSSSSQAGERLSSRNTSV